MPTQHLLRLDSSSSVATSASRQVADLVVAHLSPVHLTVRDLIADPLPFVDSVWITGRMKPPADRTASETAALSRSDALVAELFAAETIVIGVPIYNFGIPAALKAWIDLVVRPGVTFRFTANGTEPLVTGKRVILAVASASTGVGSEFDLATSYLKLILGFIGLTHVEIIAADRLIFDRQGALDRAAAQIALLPT